MNVNKIIFSFISILLIMIIITCIYKNYKYNEGHYHNYYSDYSNIIQDYILIIPFYYIYDKNRAKLTEKIFQYYTNMKEDLIKYKINFNLLLVGSEKELSRNLALKYVSEKYYIEFDQKGKEVTTMDEKLLKMLEKKLNYGFEYIKKNNLKHDIVFSTGSDDLVTMNYFLEVKKYNLNIPFLFQIGKSDNITKNNGGVYFHNIDKNKSFYWNGIYPESWTDVNVCDGVGNMTGYSKKILIKLNYNVWSNTNANECKVELKVINNGGKVISLKMKNNNFEAWNLKSGTQIHSVDNLNKLNMINIEKRPPI